MNIDSSGDPLTNLPTDKNVPSHQEVKILETFFQEKNTVEKVLVNSKDVLVIGLFFLLFSLPPADELIKKWLPVTQKSEYLLLGLKTVVFMLAYFIIKNVYLVRK